MMTLKQWTVGMVLYLGYLVIGAAFYYVSEHRIEAETRLNYRQERIEIFNLLNDHYTQPVPGDGPYIMQRLDEYCGRPVTNTTLDNDAGDGPYKWNYFNSIMFAITVTTTLGYGNLAPTSPHGRLWMILYALIGIPFTGILLATLGEFFSLVILRIQDRYKRQRIETRLGFITDIFMYISMGIVTFIFLPTCLFVYMEEWSWSLSIYYSFVTVSTVGFGDYVAGQQPELVKSEIWFTIYRVLIILWIIFGLGYYFMVLAYLTRAWRSKKVLQLEHKLAKSIKETQSKVWQGVTKDLGYLRRVLNEVYLARVQPIYRDEDELRSSFDPLKRSSSAPDISLYSYDADDDDAADPPSGVWRRRANSEAAYLSLQRRVSETDLQRIDRDATFKAASLIQPVDLLQHVVEALGSTSYVNEMGMDGFSEEEILASEGWSVVGSDDSERRPRAATVAETRIPMDDMQSRLAENGNSQWTWSGAPASRHIHELMRARQKRRNTSYHVEEETRLTPSKTHGLLERWNASKQRHKAKSLGSLLLGNGNARRGSLQNSGGPPVYTQRNYKTHTHNSSPLSLYDDPDADVDSILEETSIGEFLRALTNVHSRVIGDTYAHTLNNPPRSNEDPKSQHPPSLFNLFTPLQQPTTTHRRFSLRRVSSPNTAQGSGNRRPSLRSATTTSPPMSYTNSDISHQHSFTPPLGSIRRSSLRPTPLYSQHSSDIPYHPSFSPTVAGMRRSSLRPETPPPSYTPSYDGTRRSSLRPSGTSPSGSGRHQFPKQQPLRPRFKIGPYDKQSGEPVEGPLGPRTRHQSS